MSKHENAEMYLRQKYLRQQLVMMAADDQQQNKSQFDLVRGARCKKIEVILGSKAKEYATDTDRYHNFRVAARMANTTPEKALKGMMLKHEVSVNDLIEWSESAPERITEELIDEKIGDNINYLILLEGLLRERIANAKGVGQYDFLL